MSFQKKANLTYRERDVLAHAWAFMNVNNLDHDKLAEVMGYHNPRSLYPVLKSAKDKLNKAKIATMGEDEDPTAPSAVKPSYAPRKRKAAATSEPGQAPPSGPASGAKRAASATRPQQGAGPGTEPVGPPNNAVLDDGEA